LRIKEQETHLTLQEHDDDDDIYIYIYIYSGFLRNDEIRRRVHRNKDIMDTINMKRLIWYGHVQRMTEERWPKRMLVWVPNRRKKGEDPDETGERTYT